MLLFTLLSVFNTSAKQAYINNLNASMEKLADAEAKGDITAIVQLQAAIKFNGGGHLNHSIFWKVIYKQMVYGTQTKYKKKALGIFFRSELGDKCTAVFSFHTPEYSTR